MFFLIYYRGMNFIEKRNVLFRILAAIANLVALATMVGAFTYVVTRKPDDKTLSIIGLLLACAFVVMEIVLLIKGKKNEPALKNIAFNENDTINKFPVIIVSIGTGFSLALLILSIVIFFQNSSPTTKSNMAVIFSIAVYLLVNCLVYYLFLIMFKKRPLKLEDLIK